jgi:hypothetical protein
VQVKDRFFGFAGVAGKAVAGNDAGNTLAMQS